MRRPITLVLLLMLALLWPSTTSTAAPADLDPSFSGDGKIIQDLGTSIDHARALVRQPDGKLIVAGSVENRNPEFYDPEFPLFTFYDFAVIRYTAAGQLDTSFGGDGIVKTDFGKDFDDQAFAVTLQGDKIVVVGMSDTGADVVDYDFAIARYNSDGALDNTFSSDGLLTLSLGSLGEAAGAVGIQGAKIVAAGGTDISQTSVGNYEFATVRVDDTGGLDATFGDQGKRITSFGTRDDQAYDLVVDAGGITLGGSSATSASDYDFAIARYDADGDEVSTFDTDGKVTTSFSTSIDEAYGLVAGPPGTVVAAGTSGTSGSNVALARYDLADGSLDETFDADGKQTADLGGTDEANDVAVDGSGRIVIAGGFDNDFAVARFTAAGALDTTFGLGGKVVTNLGDVERALGVVVEPDGRITTAGRHGPTIDAPTDAALVRYLGDQVPFEIDCLPESAESSTSGTAEFSCEVLDSRAIGIEGLDVDIEASGGNDPDAGDTPGTPDFSCTTGASGTCGQEHFPSSPASNDPTTYRAWFDADSGGADTEADLTEVQADDDEDLTDVIVRQWIGPSAEVATITFEQAVQKRNLSSTASFTAVARDAGGNPVRGAAVEWTIQGQGVLLTGEVITDVDGEAVATASSTRPGSSQVSVSMLPCATSGQCTATTVSHWGPSYCTIFGTDGNDTITGTAGSDVICGFSGRDTIRGGPGHDRIIGNDGNDRLNGGSGRDRLSGGNGNDLLAGRALRDLLAGGAGSDRIYGGRSNDRLWGGSGRDRLTGGPGRDRCSGGPQRDWLRGCE